MNILYGDQTTNATPYYENTIPISNNQMARIEVTYNCYKASDFSLVSSGKINQVFSRTTALGIFSTNTDANIASTGEQVSNMATIPTVTLVPNLSNGGVDVYFNGTSDTINWNVNTLVYLS